MSNVKHETVCITSWNAESLQRLRLRLGEVVPLTGTYESEANGYHTFYVLPSGSKVGWPEATVHLKRIEVIKDIIKEFEHEDGSNPIEFKVAEYGEREG